VCVFDVCDVRMCMCVFVCDVCMMCMCVCDVCVCIHMCDMCMMCVFVCANLLYGRWGSNAVLFQSFCEIWVYVFKLWGNNCFCTALIALIVRLRYRLR